MIEMEWGMKNRLSRIFKQDGRTVMLAVDHGYFLGPTERLEDARKTIEPLLPYADSIMLTRGILRNCVDPSNDIPVVLRVSGGTSIIGKDLSNEDITTSIEDAIRINASALAMSIFVGAEYEHQTLVNLGKLVNDGEEYGIPVLAVTAVGREMARDARYLGLASRIAAELGAHMVKTYYCKDFYKVVEACPVPVIIAGGKKIPEKDALELTYNAISEGAAGVDMGRNIWQSDYPVAMIKAVNKIVHENATAEEAYEYFNSIKEEAEVQLKKSKK
ncbi:MAG: aldolase [Candidatus Nitrosocaldaceae archaeon]|nr:MAG: aldolase [Candidatus Nitrosocaldaceae archaeon]